MVQKRERGGKRKRPRSLKGKEIGNYYSALQKEKRKQEKLNAAKKAALDQRLLVDIDWEKQELMTSLIHQIKASNDSNARYFHDNVTEDINHIVRNSRSLQRRPRLDDLYKEQLILTRGNIKYQEFLATRMKLPIYDVKDKIITSIQNNQAIVISGHTGCGKTTQIPQFILDDAIDNNNASLCKILCTQPRRISAISVARRVLDERVEKSQARPSVGYQIRLENKLPRRYGSMTFCTTGVLLRQLQRDSVLSQYSHLIVDEIHERDSLSDFLLICLKDILIKRPDLKVILMSATLNAEKFSAYFGNCPIIEIPGTLYPVKRYYLEDIVTLLDNDKQYYQMKSKRESQQQKRKQIDNDITNGRSPAWDKYLKKIKTNYSPEVANSFRQMVFKKLDFTLIEDLLIYITSNMEDGAILCFVPGWDDIRKLYDTLMQNSYFSPDRYLILPLHSLLSTASQQKIFDKPQPSIRKIIIATDIAETSITINDVSFVVDCGKVKEKAYDANGGFEILAPVWASKSSARQRAGRAGRVKSGHCFYLYPKYQFYQMQDYNVPEILRTPLQELCLQIKKSNLGMISPFLSKAVDAPDENAVKQAIQLLKDMNAMDSDESLTPLGHHLATLPVDPRIGKIILFGAMFSCLYPAVVISAFLAHKDPFILSIDHKTEAHQARRSFDHDLVSDHLTCINAFYGWEDAMKFGRANEFCWQHYLSRSCLAMVSGLAQQFCDLLYDIGFIDTKNMKAEEYNFNSGNSKLLKAIICAGLYPNVLEIKYRNNKRRSPRFQTRSNEKIDMHQSSVVSNRKQFSSDWLVYHRKMKLGNQVHVFDATMVTPMPLLFFGGDITVDEVHDNISIDNWINFRATPDVANLIVELRRQLDNYLEQKIKQPSLNLVASKYMSDPKVKLLRSIVSLITEENLPKQIRSKNRKENGWL